MTMLLSPTGKSLNLSIPKVMGILNVTPDSFSDGGRFNTLDTALYHADEMIKWGVDIIDIGGESTRPNALTVDADTELDRVVPVVQAIRAKFGDDVWLSLDTSNPIVMEQGIHAGADMVNDVRGLRRIGASQMVAQLACPVIIMHSRGEPDTMTRTMNDLAIYNDVVNDVIKELGVDIQNALNAGVKRDNIVIDVGMGFAKNYAHHVALMQNLDNIIAHFNLPMLFGVSRKRFVGEILANTCLSHLQDNIPLRRDTAGMALALMALTKGVSIIRTHNVGQTREGLAVWQALS